MPGPPATAHPATHMPKKHSSCLYLFWGRGYIGHSIARPTPASYRRSHCQDPAKSPRVSPLFHSCRCLPSHSHPIVAAKDDADITPPSLVGATLPLPTVATFVAIQSCCHRRWCGQCSFSPCRRLPLPPPNNPIPTQTRCPARPGCQGHDRLCKKAAAPMSPSPP